MGLASTDDSKKYEWNSMDATGCQIESSIVALWNGKSLLDSVKKSDGTVCVILKETNFYSEAGGQVADSGSLTKNTSSPNDNETEFRVIRADKSGPYVMHIGNVIGEEAHSLKVGDYVSVSPNYELRHLTAKNHSATHMLNFALAKGLGEVCEQQGSLVDADKLRFDFSYNRSMTDGEINTVENIVQQMIKSQHPISKESVALEEARKLPGLRFLVGEQYPDPVRVVSMGLSVKELVTRDNAELVNDNVSVEFCGGTHCENTSEVADFTIITEESIAKGVRRILGLTGPAAKDAILLGRSLVERAMSLSLKMEEAPANECEVLSKELVSSKEKIPMSARKQCKEYLDKISKSKHEKEKLRLKELNVLGTQIAKTLGSDLEGFNSLVIFDARLCGETKAVDALIAGLPSDLPFFVVSWNSVSFKFTAVASVPKAHPSKLSAKEWLLEALKMGFGKGGGSPFLARGSGEMKRPSLMLPLVQQFAESVDLKVKVHDELTI